jgi:hypothetical protein
MEVLEQFKGKALSRAISQDIIITKEMKVINKGHEAGLLEYANSELVVAPLVPKSPMAKRTIFKLGKEGILCR